MFDHTTLIIIITVIVSLLAWQNKTLFNRLIFYPPAVNNGQWDRFVTHGFIHADSMHLLFNMFTLYFFGRAIEGLYRSFLFGYGFVIFYVLAIVVAMIPSYLKNKKNASYLSLGASGGVSAVLFAFILLAHGKKSICLPLFLFQPYYLLSLMSLIASMQTNVVVQTSITWRICGAAHLA